MIFSNLAAKLSPEWTARNPEEQRLSMRLWGHWDALRGADALPSRTQFTAAAGSDLRQNGFTIEITDGGHEPVFRFVGKEIVDEYGHDLAGRSVNDVPGEECLGLGCRQPRRRLAEQIADRLREQRSEYRSDNAAYQAIAPKLGCAPDSLRGWCRQSERDAGARNGPTSEEKARIKDLRFGNCETKQMRSCCRAYFAQAELDRPFRK